MTVTPTTSLSLLPLKGHYLRPAPPYTVPYFPEADNANAALVTTAANHTQSSSLIFPKEIFSCIFSFLEDPEDLAHCSKACKKFYLLASSPEILKNIFEHCFPQVAIKAFPPFSERQQIKIIFHKFLNPLSRSLRNAQKNQLKQIESKMEQLNSSITPLTEKQQSELQDLERKKTQVKGLINLFDKGVVRIQQFYSQSAYLTLMQTRVQQKNLFYLSPLPYFDPLIY